MKSLPSNLMSCGTLLDERYEIRQALGVGGFSCVYEAVQRRTDEVVAIKVVEGRRDGVVDPERLVFAEVRAAAAVSHAGVVKIRDFGRCASTGACFIVMPKLEGHDLQVECRGGLAPHRALALCRSALDALAEAHRRGVVHRDLKPSNLFVQRPGQDDESVVILDFGVAAMQRDRAEGGAILGTARYMPPESMARVPAQPSADVYQMGLVLVELLSGRPAVDGVDAYACLSHHRRGVEVPQALDVGPLGEILRMALSRDPEVRFQNAAAFRDALDAVDARLLAPIEITAGARSVRSPALEAVSDAFWAVQTDAFEPVPEPAAERVRIDVGGRAPSSRTEHFVRPIRAKAEPELDSGVFAPDLSVSSGSWWLWVAAGALLALVVGLMGVGFLF